MNQDSKKGVEKYTLNRTRRQLAQDGVYAQKLLLELINGLKETVEGYRLKLGVFPNFPPCISQTIFGSVLSVGYFIPFPGGGSLRKGLRMSCPIFYLHLQGGKMAQEILGLGSSFLNLVWNVSEKIDLRPPAFDKIDLFLSYVLCKTQAIIQTS